MMENAYRANTAELGMVVINAINHGFKYLLKSKTAYSAHFTYSTQAPARRPLAAATSPSSLAPRQLLADLRKDGCKDLERSRHGGHRRIMWMVSAGYLVLFPLFGLVPVILLKLLKRFRVYHSVFPRSLQHCWMPGVSRRLMQMNLLDA